MRVRVLLFAGLRERVGSAHVDVDVGDGARVRDVLSKLQDVTGPVPVVIALNREYVAEDAVVRQGDELALIPPVSGGSVTVTHARVLDTPLSLDSLLARVRDRRAGAVVSFLGVTREVEELDYEAYAQMAERLIAEIVSGAVRRHGLCAAAAEHRVGRVPLSEPSVAVAVSAPHRQEAFLGAREIIDEIKAQVPIWKKESGEWVRGTTPRANS